MGSVIACFIFLTFGFAVGFELGFLFKDECDVRNKHKK